MNVLLRMNAGLIVWAAAFCLLYALHGVGCAAGWAGAGAGGVSLQHAVLAGAWLASIAANVAAWTWVRRHGRAALVDRIAGWIAVAGGLATVVTGLPILLVPACA